MGLVVDNSARYWPGGRVAFEIDNNDFPAGTADRTAVENAIQHWNNNTVMNLAARNGEGDFVAFVRHATACSSAVGRQGGRQEVRCAIGAGGFTAGNVMHEIGHAVGFWHEHQRRDRNTFVTVDSSVQNNINYAIRTNDLPVGAYDCDSIMHYPPITGRITNNGSQCAAMGQRTQLSPGDIAGAAFTQEILNVQTHMQSIVFGTGANDPQNQGHKDYSFSPSGATRIVGGWWSLQEDASGSDSFKQFSIGGTSGSDNNTPTINGNTITFRVTKKDNNPGLIRVLFVVLYV